MAEEQALKIKAARAQLTDAIAANLEAAGLVGFVRAWSLTIAIQRYDEDGDEVVFYGHDRSDDTPIHEMIGLNTLALEHWQDPGWSFIYAGTTEYEED